MTVLPPSRYHRWRWRFVALPNAAAAASVEELRKEIRQIGAAIDCQSEARASAQAERSPD
jgi:hypothetical protein